MARAHFVKSARKARKEYGIKKGDSYWWWQFRMGGKGMGPIRSGAKHFSKTPPKPSQLTQSEFLSQFLALEERIGDLKADDGLEAEVGDIASGFRDLGSEQEDKKNNLPDSLQNGPTGELLEERANKCNEVADELEGLTLDDSDKEDDEDADDYWARKLEEVQGVDTSAP